jgi:hypothetical protein
LSKHRKQKFNDEAFIEIGNNVSPLPDKTLDIYSHNERTSLGGFNDSTTDVDPEVRRPLAQNTSALFEKALSGDLKLHPFYVNLFFICIFLIVIGWIFIQDNGAGKLNNIEGLEWWAIKSSIVFCVILLVAIAFNLIIKNIKKNQ